jgi:hypothetical protein
MYDDLGNQHLIVVLFNYNTPPPPLLPEGVPGVD